jgi:hypothetical protein
LGIIISIAGRVIGKKQGPRMKKGAEWEFGKRKGYFWAGTEARPTMEKAFGKEISFLRGHDENPGNLRQPA